MYRALFILAAALAVGGCASDRYEYSGGTSDTDSYNAGDADQTSPTLRPDWSIIQTNGPGMHSETSTGLPGPGTPPPGPSENWTGGSRP